MTEVRIEPVLPIVEVCHDPHQHAFPEALRAEIEEHWETLRRQGRSYTRGEIFSVASIAHTAERMKIELRSTDYAHFLYTAHHKLTGLSACRVLFPAALVETADNQILIGEMAPHTAWPGRLQCPGGGIDRTDIEEGRVDLLKVIQRELLEEVGLDIEDPRQVVSITPKYLKSGGATGNLTVIYHVKLALRAQEALIAYDDWTQSLTARGETPEFGALVLLAKEPGTLLGFLATDQRPRVEYLAPLLQREVRA